MSTPGGRVLRLRLFEVSPATAEQSGVTADELGVPEYEAVCVSGDADECGEGSGPLPDADAIELWMFGHARDTGHARFRRAYCEYAVVKPGAWQ